MTECAVSKKGSGKGLAGLSSAARHQKKFLSLGFIDCILLLYLLISLSTSPSHSLFPTSLSHTHKQSSRTKGVNEVKCYIFGKKKKDIRQNIMDVINTENSLWFKKK